MAFCINCGHEIAENAKFCANCGKAVAEEHAETKRKTTFEGVIHKCPNCGEVIGSFTTNCPSCGYEIRDASNSIAIQAFVRKMEQATTENQIISLLKNFPIPNTKEDVFEFMILAATNIVGESSLKVNKAWRVKFEQSYQKAKILFKDTDLSKVNELYERTSKQIKKQNFAAGAKATGSAVVKTSSVITKIVKTILYNLFSFLSMAAFLKAIQVDRLGDNGVGYELLGGILLITSSSLLFKKATSFLDIAITIGAGVFTFYLAKFLDNGSGLQLFGAIALLITFCGFIHKAKNGNNEKGE